MPQSQADFDKMKKNQEKMLVDRKKEIKRNIRTAYKVGNKVPYDMRTLIESGVSLNVIRAVYRGS